MEKGWALGQGYVGTSKQREGENVLSRIKQTRGERGDRYSHGKRRLTALLGRWQQSSSLGRRRSSQYTRRTPGKKVHLKKKGNRVPNTDTYYALGREKPGTSTCREVYKNRKSGNRCSVSERDGMIFSQKKRRKGVKKKGP